MNQVSPPGPDELELKLQEALALHAEGRLGDAELAEAYSRLALALLQARRLDEAMAGYDKVLALSPNHFVAHCNRGAVLHDLGRLDEALACQEKAVALQPASAVAHNNRAAVLNDLGRPLEAVAGYDKAIALQADYAHAYFYCGRALLLTGQYERGWEYYEWRKRLKNESVGGGTFTGPLWLGDEDIAGKTVLVHWEQGDGDTFQFCRYVPLLERAGARVLFAPQRRLRHLLRSVSPTALFTHIDEPGLKFDFHCPLMSLPRAFRTTLATVPGRTPYLAADPHLVAHWKRRLGPDGFKIGICWQGSAAKIDVGRSFPLAHFAPLAALPGVRLISLQKGAGEAQLASLPAGMKVESFGKDFDSGPDSFLDSAAVIENCDLVISSDTGIAHLAGALGHPTWLALKRVPEFRWLLDRADSPWYPTMRLFRQRTHGDWNGVFAEMARTLEALLAAKGWEAAPTPHVAVSWGELIDKVTILEIKSTKLTDPAQRANVDRELALLAAATGDTLARSAELRRLRDRLRQINEALWLIEDRVREKEALKSFDAAFVELARSVYHRNDERGAVKRSINELLGSALVEEKSYHKY